jgi:hypothetical protein
MASPPSPHIVAIPAADTIRRARRGCIQMSEVSVKKAGMP